MPKEPKKRNDFSEQITIAWQKSIAAIFECGRLLIAAKDKLGHGEFGEMIEHDLPFGERTAQRLMAIARDKRLANPTHVSHLPCAWGALYELTKLSDNDFDFAITSGTINANMTRADALELVARAEAEAETQAEATTEDDSSGDNEPRMPLATHRMLAPGTTEFPGGLSRARRRAARHGSEPLTAADLLSIKATYQESADRIVTALLALAAESECDTPEVVKLVLANSPDTLDDTRRGIEFAARLKVALAGSLQLVD